MQSSTFRFRISFRAITFACAALLCSGGAWAGTTRTVPTDGSIEEVLAVSGDGDVIEIEEGTYTLVAVGVHTLVDKAVTIRGTGDTAADVVIKANDTETFKCFFNISNEHAVIEKVTLTGAKNNTDSASNPESCRNSSLLLYEGTLKDCIIKDNHQRDIGTVRVIGGLVTGCTFDNNKSYSDWSHWLGRGGALFQQGGVVSNCLFTANDARCYGGAAFVRGGLLTHSTFRDNKLERHHGSSIVISGGTVAHCHVTGSSFSSSQGKGGAVSVWRGELRDSDICTNNTMLTVGGGVSVVSGSTGSLRCDGTSDIDTSVSFRKVTRCRIFDNTSTGDGAGVYMEADGTVDHCTISGNKAGTGIGSGVELSIGTLKNSIVFGNGTVNGYNADNIRCTGSGVVATTCTQPAVAGTGNLDKDPLFTNAALYDYSLLLGSPCIGTGLDEGEVASDMGAIPFVAPTAPTCTFVSSKDVLEGLGTVTLQATVANAEGLTVVWDLDDDGVFDDATGIKVDWTITEYGSHPVAVALVNGSGEVQTSFRREDVVRTKVAKAYVNAEGTADFPYATKATGAHTVEEALDAVYTSVESPAEVVVCDGTYQVQGAALKILVPIKLTSENGPATTFIQGWNSGSANSDYRVMIVDNDKAFVSGLTLEKGKWYSPTYGDEGCGGLRLISGTVTNCVIRDNAGNDTGGGVNVRGGLLTHCVIYGNTVYRGNNTGVGDGGGVYMTGGEMNDCVITNNAATRVDGGCGVKLNGNGTIRRCLIADNYGKCSKTEGIGLWMNNGTVERCRIVGNGVRSSTCSTRGGGVKISGGTLRNCLITGNRTTTQSAAVHQTGGTVENCTISGNTCSAATGSGLYLNGSAAVARNNIIYGNGLGVAGEPLCNIEFSAANAFTKNIVSPATQGTDNSDADPLFKDAANGDYRLGAGSPAIDAALEVGLTEDLAGNLRPKNGSGTGAAPDIGCYEAAGIDEGPLECSIAATVKVGYDSVTTKLTANAVGEGSLGEVHYAWNVGKGVISGETDAKTVDVTFSDYGYHTVTVTVTAGENQASKTETDFISVGTRKAYVNQTGSGTWPFATPETGTNDISVALTKAILDENTLYEIEVDDGEYPILDKWLILSGRVRISSKHGAAFTTLRAANPEATDKRKYIHLNNENAVVEGLTLTGGWWDANLYSDDGGSVRVTAGVFRNCVIRDTLGGDNAGGADILGGVVSNCVFYNCESFRSSNAGGQGYGGGFTVSGPALVTDCLVSNCYAGVNGGGIRIKDKNAVVSNCVVTGCRAGYSKRDNASFESRDWVNYYRAGGVLLDSGMLVNVKVTDCYAYNRIGGLEMTSADATARNVLVANCAAYRSTQGFQMSAGTIENVTIAGNGTNAVSGVAAATLTGGTMVNCIVAGNADCATQLAQDSATVSATYTGSDPKFRRPEKGDYRLLNASPCIDAGVLRDWMTDGATDLRGNPRVKGALPDQGCYENRQVGLMLIVR